MNKLSDEEKFHLVLVENVKELLKIRAGKDVIWNILSMCNLYNDNFTGNSHTFYLEGKRSVGLELLDLIHEADPRAYASLMLEKEKENG